MLGFRHLERDHTVEGVAGLKLSYADTGFGGVIRLGAGGLSYRRPTSVTVPGTGSAIPIRDHVMLVRLVMVMVLFVVNLRRRRHGG
jgi:hypothetical protein